MHLGPSTSKVAICSNITHFHMYFQFEQNKSHIREEQMFKHYIFSKASLVRTQDILFSCVIYVRAYYISACNISSDKRHHIFIFNIVSDILHFCS